MKLSATYTLPAPRDKVFAALTNPEILCRSIEGCEKLERTGEDHYEGKVRVGIAMVRGTFSGKVQITDKRPPEALTLLLEGKGAPGFARGTARIELVEEAGSTKLIAASEVMVGGLLASVGSRLMESAAKKMLDDFFTKFRAAVAP